LLFLPSLGPLCQRHWFLNRRHSGRDRGGLDGGDGSNRDILGPIRLSLLLLGSQKDLDRRAQGLVRLAVVGG
jgi:hypothetical protein